MDGLDPLEFQLCVSGSALALCRDKEKWTDLIGLGFLDYAMVALRELPDSREHLRRVIVPVVLFIAFSSTVAHVRLLPPL